MIDTNYPMELNRYVYAAGNPITWSDPSGYFSIEFGNIVKRLNAIASKSLVNLQRFVVTNYLNVLYQLADSPWWVRWIVYYVTGIQTPFKTSVPKPTNVRNTRLNRIVDQMYRPEARVGPHGSLQDAIRAERATGLAVGNRPHITKGRNMLNALRNWIGDVTFPKRGMPPEQATDDELITAINLFTDLYDAINGSYYDGPPGPPRR